MELVLGDDLPDVLAVVSKVLDLPDVTCLDAAGVCGSLLVVHESPGALHPCP